MRYVLVVPPLVGGFLAGILSAYIDPSTSFLLKVLTLGAIGGALSGLVFLALICFIKE